MENEQLTGANIDTSAEVTEVQESATDSQQETVPAASEPVQEQKSERLEKAFAARLSKEREKMRQEYADHLFVLEKAAAESDMTAEEYVQELAKKYRGVELESIDPSIREDVLWAREKRSQEKTEKQKQAEEQKWNSEITQLLKTFPDVKSAKDIPDEVLEWRIADGVPLEYAYAKYALGKERTKIEQETIKKLERNSQSATGSMATSTIDTKPSVSDMSSEDFEKLKQEVLSGKRRTL